MIRGFGMSGYRHVAQATRSKAAAPWRVMPRLVAIAFDALPRHPETAPEYRTQNCKSEHVAPFHQALLYGLESSSPCLDRY